MTTYEPLSIGEIFDRAVTIVVQRWRALLWWAALLGIWEVLSDLLSREIKNVWEVAAGTLFILALSTIPNVAIIAICAGLGASDSGSLLRLGLQRFWSAFGLSVFYLIVFYSALAVCFIPTVILKDHEAGIAIFAFTCGILFAMVAAAYVVAFYIIAYVYVVLEGLTPNVAIRATIKRTNPSGWRRLLLAGACISVLTLVPAFGSALIPDQPLPLFLCKLLIAFLLQSVFAYGSAVCTVLAIDYRNRSLGTDVARIVAERAQA